MAMLSLDVQLTTEALVHLFHHFDPNESGSVHYGEFLWAFFNRRDLARRWKRSTRGLTRYVRDIVWGCTHQLTGYPLPTGRWICIFKGLCLCMFILSETLSLLSNHL